MGTTLIKIPANVGASYKSYSLSDVGPSGTHDDAGFYDVSASDANLTQASLSQAFGSTDNGVQHWTAHIGVIYT